jgi:hypothetical protein
MRERGAATAAAAGTAAAAVAAWATALRWRAPRRWRSRSLAELVVRLHSKHWCAGGDVAGEIASAEGAASEERAEREEAAPGEVAAIGKGAGWGTAHTTRVPPLSCGDFSAQTKHLGRDNTSYLSRCAQNNAQHSYMSLLVLWNGVGQDLCDDLCSMLWTFVRLMESSVEDRRNRNNEMRRAKAGAT